MGAQSDRDNWIRWVTVIVLMGAMIFSIVDRFAISLLVEPIKADLGLTDRDIGLLSGVSFGLFYAFMALPMGLLADRWSPKGVILGGIAVWSVATAACGLASNYVQLMLARIGVGAGEAGLAPASYSVIANLFPRRLLARALSVFQMGALLGSGIAFWVVGIIYAHLSSSTAVQQWSWAGLAPWQLTFIAVAMPGVFFLVAVALIRAPRSPRPPLGDRKGLVMALRDDSAFFILLFLTMSGVLIVNYALLSWVPSILQREVGLSPSEAGAAYGMLVLAVSPIAVICGGSLADWLDRRGFSVAHSVVPAISAVLLTALSSFLFLAHDEFTILAIVGGMHFAANLSVGVVPAMLQLRAPPEVRSSVSALYVLVLNFAGLGVGPILVGALSDQRASAVAGLRDSVAIVSLGASVMAVLAVGVLIRHRDTRSPIVA